MKISASLCSSCNIFCLRKQAIRDGSMLCVQYQCSPGFSCLLNLLSFPQQMCSRQVSWTSHVMLTLTHHLYSCLFLVLDTHLSLPKALWTPFLWNQIPHLTHILGPPPILPVLLNVLLFTLLFYSNRGRKYRHKLRLRPCIQWATKSYDPFLPCQPLGFS